MNVTAGAGALTPVPLSVTACGLPAASSATLTLALLTPSVVGLNFTPKLQLVPAFSALAPSGHIVPVVGAPSVNCVASVPVSVMPVMFMVAWPVFDSVTSVVALDVLMT